MAPPMKSTAWRRAGQHARETLQDIGEGLSLRDVLSLAGIVLLAAGFAMAWLPLGLIVPGAIFTYLGVFGVSADDRGTPPPAE